MKPIRPIKPPKCRPTKPAIKPRPRPTKPPKVDQLMWFKKLSAAISSLARAIDELAKQRKNECECVKSHAALATKCDLKEMEDRIMSKFSEYAAEQKEYNRQLGEALTSISESNADIVTDLADLNAKITELQNRPDGWTAEDQALLDEIRAGGSELTAKASAAATALREAANLHPPVVPPA